jgi:hypothetical protein
VPCRQQPCGDLIGKDVRRPPIRDVTIEPIEVRESASDMAKHLASFDGHTGRPS